MGTTQFISVDLRYTSYKTALRTKRGIKLETKKNQKNRNHEFAFEFWIHYGMFVLFCSYSSFVSNNPHTDEKKWNCFDFEKFSILHEIPAICTHKMMEYGRLIAMDIIMCMQVISEFTYSSGGNSQSFLYNMQCTSHSISPEKKTLSRWLCSNLKMFWVTLSLFFFLFFYFAYAIFLYTFESIHVVRQYSFHHCRKL